ncbi:MAG: hypothetical protein CM1200mP28_08160 [Deltaproteobacteria bacterium]|nr:MAG: hypothetical protein CM1200mP28_08160 [Deltaproteobacteria bacterium]
MANKPKKKLWLILFLIALTHTGFRRKNFKISRPILMGILNTTPDSFSEDSSFFEHDDALTEARKLIADGADWLDMVESLRGLAVKKCRWRKNYGG